MKKNINLTDGLDSAFTKAIVPLEIEPSEFVWGKVDSGLMTGENLLLKRKILFWKKISGIFSLLFVGSGLFLFFHFTNHEIIHPSILTEKNTSTPINQKQELPIIPSVEKESFVFADKPRKIGTSMDIQKKEDIINQPLAFVISKDNSEKVINRQNDRQVEKEEQELNEKNYSNATNSYYVLPATDSISFSKVYSPFEESNLTPVVLEKNKPQVKDSAVLIKENESCPETLVTTISSMPEKIDPHTSGILSRFYVEGIFSPEANFRFLKDNNANDVYTKKNIKQHEANIFSHSQGVKIGFDIKEWSIESGCIYFEQSIAINAISMYPYESNGNLHCSLVTSSGVVDVAYFTYQFSQYSTDSMKVKKGSYQTLGFLNIPLQLKYKFGGSKLSYYILSGVSANILLNQETNVIIDQGYANNDNKAISKINGVKDIYYGYSLGVGANYRFCRGFYLNVEPILRGAISSLNRDTPVKSYPCTLGFGFIAGYHF